MVNNSFYLKKMNFLFKVIKIGIQLAVFVIQYVLLC